MFKGNRLVNGHTTETVAKNHLDYKIHHRFGRINEGAYQFFGIDNAQMFMGFDYGVTDKLTMGVGRSNENKTFTGLIKYKIIIMQSIYDSKEEGEEKMSLERQRQIKIHNTILEKHYNPYSYKRNAKRSTKQSKIFKCAICFDQVSKKTASFLPCCHFSFY